MTTAIVYPSRDPMELTISPTVRTAGMPEPPAGVPASISRHQLYYWSKKWQADEAESLAALAAGEGHAFETSQDAMRWLLSGDD
jgi:hypothetical protein